MATDMMEYLNLLILIQMFFAVSITIFSYALPTDAKMYINEYSSMASSSNLEATVLKLKDSLNSQLNIPIIEVGALVFYSGNIIVDLLLNFIFAIPEMITLLINGICTIISIDSYYIVQLQIFIGAVISAGYILGIITFVTQLRGGRL